MRFTNSIRLLLENFKQVYRLLLFKVITAFVVFAVCSALIFPELLEIVENPVWTDLWANVKNIFLAVFDHEQGKSPSYYIEAVFAEGGLLRQFLDLLFSMRWGILVACIGCVIVYLFKCFLDETAHFAVGSAINDKMSTYADSSFSTSFIANFGKASAYAGVYVPLTFVVDCVTLGLACLFLRFLPLFMALFLTVTEIVLLQALKLTLTSPLLPGMTVDSKKVFQAFCYEGEREKKQIGKVFALYFVTLYMVIIVNVVAALCTFGSALIITLPTSYVLLICEQYVVYYTLKGKKYFITYDSIASNPDYGDRAHFFDYIEDQTKEESVEETQENK